MSSRSLKRIFIVGCPRSGTTLLQSMLAAHSQLHSFPETHFWDYTVPEKSIYRWFKIYGPSEKEVVQGYLRKYDLNTETKMRPFYLSTRGWSGMLFELLDSITPANVDGWIEKTPRHLNYIPQISAVQPETKFVHILREGKDVVASMFQVTQANPEQWGGARDIDTCIGRWKEDVQRSKRYLENPSHSFLTYDELVNRKEKVLRQLCDSLDITFEQAMIEEFSSEAENLIGQEEKWKQANVSGRRTGDKFSRIFNSQEQQYIIEALAEVSLEPFHIISRNTTDKD